MKLDILALWRRDNFLLVLCGALLIISQYVVIREIGSTFFSTEIITVIGTIMVLLGPSLAYSLSHRVSEKTLSLWGILTFLALLSCPVSIRYLVAIMSAIHLEFAAFVIVFLSGCLFFSAFFAIFLPRFCTQPQIGSFRKLYALELIGALSGLLIIGASLNFSWHVLITVFWLLIVIVLHLSLNKKWLTAVCFGAVFAASCFYPQLDKLAMEKYLQNYWEVKNASLIETVYSPFQRIDIVEEPEGRAIYLDGVPYYQTGDLHWFNYYISALPGALVKNKGEALVIGSGSLLSTSHLVKQGFTVTTIDIDKDVAELGLKYFSAQNNLKKNSAGFNLVIDDARAYISKLGDKKFDLIVMDTPAPYHLQTSMLYTKTFFTELKKHMNPQAVASINTCSWHLDDEIGASIAKGASEVFEDITAIQGESAGLTIMYCSDQLPFDTNKLRNELSKVQEKKFTVYDRAGLSAFIDPAKIKAHGIKNPIALLTLSRIHLPKLPRLQTK